MCHVKVHSDRGLSVVIITSVANSTMCTANELSVISSGYVCWLERVLAGVCVFRVCVCLRVCVFFCMSECMFVCFFLLTGNVRLLLYQV